MLCKFLGYSTVAAAVMLVGSASSMAHEGHDNMCGGVSDARDAMVMTSSGKPLLLGSSAPCPEEQQVAAVETKVETVEVEPAADAAAGPLPHDGLVYFDLDSAELSAEDQAMLDDIIAAVSERNPTSVTVMGHADRSGGEDYNMTLSERRAATVAAALQEAGIAASAINTMGYGETRPAIQTEDGVAMRQNRRAEIEVQ